MSNNCLAGFPAFGPRVETKITYNPVEYIPESPIALPASLPDTAQVQFTVNAASLPQFSPVFLPPGKEGDNFFTLYKVYTILGFYNSNAASKTVTVYYKSANPATFTYLTGGSIGAGKYKSALIDKSITVLAPGDLHEVKCYTSSTTNDVYLLWAYMVIAPHFICKLYGTNYQMCIKDLAVDVSMASWIGAGQVWAPPAGYAGPYLLIRRPDGTGHTFEFTANLKVGAMQSPNSEYLLRLPVLSTSGWGYDRATDDKAHVQQRYPTRIAYTPIL